MLHFETQLLRKLESKGYKDLEGEDGCVEMSNVFHLLSISMC